MSTMVKALALVFASCALGELYERTQSNLSPRRKETRSVNREEHEGREEENPRAISRRGAKDAKRASTIQSMYLEE